MGDFIRTSRTSTIVGCNDCHGLRRVVRGRRPRGMADCACTPRWVGLCRRTDDPKLAWIERALQARGIPSRRNGFSFHGPILEVHEADADAAWALLGERLGRRRTTIDDMADDDPAFDS